MFEPYRELLTRLRRDPEQWQALRYHPVPAAKFEKEDANARTRFGVLLCLKYDLLESDHALVRACLEQEILEEEECPWEGQSYSLEIAVYLLSSFRRAEDIPLLWRAKKSNSDNWESIDFSYLLWTDRSAASALLAQEDDKTRQALLSFAQGAAVLKDAADLEAWWESKRQVYPAREEDEDLLR